MAGFNPFSSIPVQPKKRTKFNLSHSLSGTFPLSKVVPVLTIDSLPGSSYNINVYNLTKLETLIAPAMQRINASLLWFKFPKRLVFKHFKKWYSGGADGQDDHQKPHFHIFSLRNDIHSGVSFSGSSDYSKFTEDFFGPGTLWSYLGLPTPLEYVNNVWRVRSLETWDDESDVGDPDSDFIDLIPIMGYSYIYDCYFRDQTLNDPVFEDSEEGNFTIAKGFVWKDTNDESHYFGPKDKEPAGMDYQYFTSGNDLSEGGEINWVDVLCLLNLFNRAWNKEYFTSALPSPQRGPEVTLKNWAENAPVTIPPQNLSLKDDLTQHLTFEFENDPTSSLPQTLKVGPTSHPYIETNGATNYVTNLIGKSSALEGVADMSNISPITIVALRNLFKLQAFLEKNNVSGGRYIETILAHWGERVPDFTVQRPQFVRATSLPVQINEVTATANTQGYNSQVGDQAGRARTQGNLGNVHIYTQEPSIIIGLYCVTAPSSYVGQGIPRQFQHVTRFDEPWTDFQHIGEQAIKSRELYFPFEDADLKDVDFGYQQRFSEYKYLPDRVVGDFQTSLSFWHMARMFNKQPALNGDFITQHLDPRIFAVQSGRPVTADFFFEISAKEKLSKFSTPKMS